MRKIMVVVMVFLSVSLAADTIKDQIYFTLSLNKSGTNMIRITEIGENQAEKTSIGFTLDKNDANYVSNPAHTPALESFRISWNIYAPDYAANSSAELYLDFESYAGDNQFMMRQVDPVSANIVQDGLGLNYNVSIRNNYSLNEYSPQPSGIYIANGSSNIALSSTEDGNRIYLFNSNIDPYKGETGYADFNLRLEPPTDGYVTGQYQGRIAINLVIN